MHQKTLHRLLCLGLILAVMPSSALASLQVTFFDEGMGTSALVQADGQTMLIDARSEEGTNAVLNYLDGTPLKKIDLLAGTLLREDHIGGLSSVLNKYQISTLWLPAAWTDDPAYQSLLTEIQASDARMTIPKPGDRYDLGKAKITVFPGRTGGDAMPPSLVIRIDYAAYSLLFVSGGGAFGEGGLIPDGAGIDADVLAIDKLVSGSLSQDLLDKVSPLWVIAGGDGEIPQEEKQTFLKDQGIHVLQPGKDKTIKFNSDGITLQADHEASGFVIKSSVNLRKDTSTKSGKVASLGKGTVVAILGTKAGAEGIWYAIEASGKTGFVRADLIEEISQTEAEKLLAEAALKPRSSSSNKQNDGDVAETQEEAPADCH